jgi:hypothetical protein
MFEIIHGSHAGRKLEMLGKGQARVLARVDLNVACKRVLSATSKCYLAGIEKEDGGARVSGKVVTRIIYIDEFDGFNSEERTDTFTERLVVKVGGSVSMNAAAIVLETNVTDNAGQSVEVDSVIDLVLVGLVEKETKFVAGITGQAEARRERTKISTFDRAIEERFSADEKLELDKNCMGVLGVDCSACVRDIYVDDGRVTIKGTISANVIAVKNGETAVMHNAVHEFDFSKTVHLSGLTAEDTVFGNVAVAGVAIKAENKIKPELSIEVDLVFNGHVVVTREIEFVKDAFASDFGLNFSSVAAEQTVALQQANLGVDVEGNMTMPGNAPYIARIFTASGAHITSINLGVSDGKVSIEGVLTATVVYECEEKQIHSHEAQVPFSTNVRIEGIGEGFAVQASVSVIVCYIKARRGKELMVDAKLGVSISASQIETCELTAEITQGEAKSRDDSAIVIYSVEAGEGLWEVAKRISMPTAEIIKQNPGCEKGVATGDKIFIYRQQVINF